jgi:hypothetical protein
MAKVEINIQIDKDGTLRCEVKGIKGEACTHYMEMIEAILNSKVKSHKKTTEYYQKDALITSEIKTKKV